jgi:hypothetical protein
VKDITALRQEFQMLEVRKQEALSQADTGRAFEIAPQLNRNLDACRKLLYEERDPNLAKAQDLLAEAETLLGQLRGWQPDPPKEQFEQMQGEIEIELLLELQKHQPGSDHGGQLQAIVKMAEKALEEKDAPVWADANRRLADLRGRILAILEEEERKKRIQAGDRPQREEPPDPRVIKLKLGMDLTHLRKEAKRRERLADLVDDFAACEQALKDIDSDANEAMLLLSDYYENKHQPLQAKVVGLGKTSGALPKGLVEALQNNPMDS